MTLSHSFKATSALAGLLALLCAAAPIGAHAADNGFWNNGDASPVLKTSLPPAAGTLKAGALTVRLEQFLELRDGTVEAQVSFRNPDGAAASFVLSAGDHGAADTASLLRLTNGEGARYRLLNLSSMNDGQSSRDWVSIPAGRSASFTAIFAPEGTNRGIQPFALSIPVRIAMASSVAAPRFYEVNFRGLHRDGADMPRVTASPAAPVSLLPPARPGPITGPMTGPITAPITGAITEPMPAPAAAPVTSAHFDDDIASAIAALPAARPDAKRYLFAIGVSAYDDAPTVPFADRSAQAMTELLRKRYGIPDENITLITGADTTGMKIIGRLNSLIQRLTPGDTVYFYYAGHGLSGREGDAVYMVPKDAVPGAYEVEMLSLGALLRRFEASNAMRVVAFVDTCFSGRISQHESLFPGVGPLVPTALPSGALNGSSKVTLFLAGQSFQFANDYPERGHRLFSYFVMRGLLDGIDNPASLEDYVAREVRRISSKRGADFLQEPQLEGATLSLANNDTLGQLIARTK